MDYITFIQVGPGRPSPCLRMGEYTHSFPWTSGKWITLKPAVGFADKGFMLQQPLFHIAGSLSWEMLIPCTMKPACIGTDWVGANPKASAMNSTACSKMQQMKNRQISILQLWTPAGEAVTNWLLGFTLFCPCLISCSKSVVPSRIHSRTIQALTWFCFII